jgi:hypothetical protein
MRQQLIEALSYPRQLVLDMIEERDCPHASLFEVTNERCQQCELNKECHWVRCLNDFSDFEGKPAYTVNASVRYGIKLVQSLTEDPGHQRDACTCESCSWLRDAERLTQAFEQQLAPNAYRPAH